MHHYRFVMPYAGAIWSRQLARVDTRVRLYIDPSARLLKGSWVRPLSGGATP